jgi:hypothetical protein
MAETDLFYIDQDLIEDINIIFDEPSIAASSLDFEFDFNELFPMDHEVSVKVIEKEDKSTQTPGSWESFPKYRRGKYKQKAQSGRKKARTQESPNPDVKETVPATLLEINERIYCIINNE